MASQSAQMALTSCIEYSAFAKGIVKGGRKFLEGRTAGTPFGLPDLPFHGSPAESAYDVRRIVLLERLIDRMIYVCNMSQIVPLKTNLK